MSNWNTANLTAIDDDGELRVAAHRPDGTLRDARIVWHVVVDGNLYIRSVRGECGAWYRAVLRTGTGAIDAGGIRTEVTFTLDGAHHDGIDDAYRAKYGTGSAVRSITTLEASATTLRIEPR